MDITLHSKRIDASSKKLVTLCKEYSKPKSDEITARKVLVKMFLEVAQQNTLIGEQIAQLDGNIKLKS